MLTSKINDDTRLTPEEEKERLMDQLSFSRLAKNPNVSDMTVDTNSAKVTISEESIKSLPANKPSDKMVDNVQRLVDGKMVELDKFIDCMAHDSVPDEKNAFGEYNPIDSSALEIIPSQYKEDYQLRYVVNHIVMKFRLKLGKNCTIIVVCDEKSAKLLAGIYKSDLLDVSYDKDGLTYYVGFITVDEVTVKIIGWDKNKHDSISFIALGGCSDPDPDVVVVE